MSVVRADALRLPLRDASVDLVVTSPPYFALRSYRDGDAHYDGQLGSEPSPAEFLEALWAATAEMARVLKPTGSIFVNLGDKYAGSGGHNNAGVSDKSTLKHDGRARPRPVTERELQLRELAATRRNAPDRYNQNTGGVPAKSLMGLPWRYAIGCIDRLGLILRAEVIWSKPNGLPESVTDRVRRSHEQWFHLVRQGRYFSAVDEVREPQLFTGGEAGPNSRRVSGNGVRHRDFASNKAHFNPLGKLPGSVWTIPSEPLIIPAAVQAHYRLPDHFAAFPQEWPRRIILGWSPSGVCVECGEGRRPVVDKELFLGRWTGNSVVGKRDGVTNKGDLEGMSYGMAGKPRLDERTTIVGYACACTPHTEETVTRPGFTFHDHANDAVNGMVGTTGRGPVTVTETQRRYDFTAPAPLIRPAVVLDPFGGTGTVAMVARTLGRVGLSLDLSADYGRLARWRIHHSGHAAKTEDRTWADQQGALF